MNEELSQLIDTLVSKGASDEEIEIIIKDYQSRSAAPQTIQVSPIVMGAAGALGNLDLAQSPLFQSAVGAVGRGVAQAQQANVLRPLGDEVNANTAQELASAQQTIQQLPASPAYQRFNEAKTFGDALSEIFSVDGPQIIAELSVESLAAMVSHGVAKIAGGAATGAAVGSVFPGAGTLAGAGIGAIGGVGLTSLNLEYAGSVMTSLSELGIDTTDPQAIADAFADEEKFAEFRSKATAKGVPIAILDMLSAGIAGSILRKVGTKTLGRKVLGNILEVGTQGALGGTGEVAGELAAGEELSAPAILGEVFGEFGPGSVEIAAGVAARGKGATIEKALDDPNTANVKINDEDYNIELGNEFDVSIDESARRDSDFINNLIVKLDEAEGGKVEEQIKAAEAAAVSAMKKAREAERQLYIRQKLDEFESLGTIIPQRASEESDVELYSNLPTPPVTPAAPTPAPMTNEQLSAAPAPIVSKTPKPPVQRRKTIDELEYDESDAVAETSVTEPAKVKPVVTKEQVETLNKEAEVLKANAEKLKAAKLQEIEDEKRLKLEEKITKQLENAKKRKPAARLAIYEKLATQADEAGLTKLAKQAAKLSDQEAQAQAEKAEAKEIKVAKKEARAQELIAPKPPKAEEPILPVKIKKMDVKVPGTLKYLGLNKQEATVGEVKEGFLKEIAYLRGSSDPKYREVAQNYIDFRKNAGLPEQSMDKVLGEAKKEFYESKAAKRISDEKVERTALKKRAEELKKKGKSDPEVQKVIEESKEKYRKDFAKVFGIEPKDISDVKFSGRFDNIVEFANDALGVVDYDSINEISYNAFKKLAGTQGPLLDSLLRVIQRYSQKPLIFHTLVTNRPSYSGVHLSSKNANHIILAIDRKGNPYGKETALHELLHDYTNLMLAALYDRDKSFRRTIGRTFKVIDYLAVIKTTDILKKLNSAGLKGLSKEQFQLYLTLNKLIPADKSELLHSYLFANTSTKDADTDAARIVNSVYAMLNEKELLSEAFSDQNTIEFLSSIKTDEKISGTKQYKSVLYKIYEELVKFLKSVVPSEYKSAMDILLEDVARFDEEFTSEQGVIIDTAELSVDVNLSELPKKLKQAEEVANKDIVKQLTKTLSNRPQVKELKDVQDYITRVNANLPAQKQLGDLYARAVLARLKQLQRRRASGKVYQSMFLTQARNKPQYKSSFKYKVDVDDFAKVSIDDLNTAQISTYTTGLANLAANQNVAPEAYDIVINFGKKKELLNMLLPLAKKLNQNVEGLMGYLKTQASNPATFSSILAKYIPENADKVMAAIYGGAMGSISRSSKQAELFYLRLSDYSERHSLTYSDHVKVGMVGAILSTKTDPVNLLEWEKEVLANAQHVVDSAKNKLEAKKAKNYKGDLTNKRILREIEIAEEINAQLTKKVKLDGLLRPSQKGLYDLFREFTTTHEKDFERNSVGIWRNKKYESRYGYFPTMPQGKVSGDVKNDPFIFDKGDNLMEAFEGEKNYYDSVYGKRSNSIYSRTLPKGYFYEYDTLAIAQRWSKRMLYDLYGSIEMKTTNRLLKDQSFTKSFEKRLRDEWKDQLKNIAGASNKFGPASTWLGRNALAVRSKLYSAAIATSGQLLLQSSSGFVAAAVLSANLNPKTALKTFGKAVSTAYQSTFDNFGLNSNTKKLQAWLDENGMGIQLRDVLFEKHLSPEDYASYLSRKGSKLGNAAENITDWSLRSGDKLAARLVWFAAYYNAGGTLENPTREAVIAAERMVGIMQNMSDVNFSAPMFKQNTLTKQLLLSSIYAFKSFAVNSFVNLFYSTRYSLSSGEARQVAAAQLGSILAYQTLATIAVRPFYNMIAESLTGEGDSDEDNEKSVSKTQEILGESAWSIFGLGMVSPAAVDQFLRYVAVNAAADYLAPEYEEFDAYKDSPIYSPKSIEDSLFELGGPAGKQVIKLSFDGADLFIAQMQADEYFETMEESEKRDFKTQMMGYQIFGMIAASQGWIPLRGDFKRVLDGYVRKRKSQEYLNSQVGGSVSPLGEDGVEAPEYNFPEYNYEPIN